MSSIFPFPAKRSPAAEKIRIECGQLAGKQTRGELGSAIAKIVLAYSPRDLQQMRWNFSEKIHAIDPGYRKKLEETITEHLHGTYQAVRLMEQQGTFAGMSDTVPEDSPAFWGMVAAQCAEGGDEEVRLRFLKYLLSGFCMLVQSRPGHPVGMVFPGGDKVEIIDGVYYCPVRTKANDVDAALCPFCPARQTPAIGYLKPPVNASEHRKQEYIGHVYEHHHFNG
ncbi:MAG TPA: DUF2115 domain-containing protein [Methanoregulaceae archaeon]|nr:DUF2115 domain-containing protein [Methanoregulaceae archaeon]HPD75254.1 DUF2115 domain-containing protein [Methanoregulaceae archaeon]HRY75095.1 DUF2115 domain-containing protein [Methanoregulaceae archaeon]